jgi:hypothetical protein
VRDIMYVELRSTAWLDNNTADRPSFAASICGTFSGPQPFQVFAMERGLLFLELRNKPGSGGSVSTNAVVAGAVLGGAIGAVIGGMLTSKAGRPAEPEQGFSLLSEDELIELARSRKRSFVAKYDEIQSVSIDAPGSLGRMVADRNLAGRITLRDSTLGKVKMEILNQMAMSVAVEALPRRLGDRVRVNVELDPRTARFVRK